MNVGVATRAHRAGPEHSVQGGDVGSLQGRRPRRRAWRAQRFASATVHCNERRASARPGVHSSIHHRTSAASNTWTGLPRAVTAGEGATGVRSHAQALRAARPPTTTARRPPATKLAIGPPRDPFMNRRRCRARGCRSADHWLRGRNSAGNLPPGWHPPPVPTRGTPTGAHAHPDCSRACMHGTGRTVPAVVWSAGCSCSFCWLGGAAWPAGH